MTDNVAGVKRGGGSLGCSQGARNPEEVTGGPDQQCSPASPADGMELQPSSKGPHVFMGQQWGVQAENIFCYMDLGGHLSSVTYLALFSHLQN